mmetsp:Transcript_30007/g.73897  ORF Transcript_30007/g.73897 Transcript_30007/m.73897 type:complete len:209 (-) Transcript_30007:777-1403(-)
MLPLLSMPGVPPSEGDAASSNASSPVTSTLCRWLLRRCPEECNSVGSEEGTCCGVACGLTTMSPLPFHVAPSSAAAFSSSSSFSRSSSTSDTLRNSSAASSGAGTFWSASSLEGVSRPGLRRLGEMIPATAAPLAYTTFVTAAPPLLTTVVTPVVMCPTAPVTVPVTCASELFCGSSGFSSAVEEGGGGMGTPEVSPTRWMRSWSFSR